MSANIKEENLKLIDAKQYISVLREIIQSGKEVTITVTGSSMAPFLIHMRDAVRLAPIQRALKVGDIAFFQRKSGAYVIHRICRIEDDKYYFIGDAQITTEGPIELNQIFALTKAIRRKGKWYTQKDLMWKFFEIVWIHAIPIRRCAIHIYGGLYASIKKLGKKHNENNY